MSSHPPDRTVAVSVIIVSYNTRELTLDCLRSLFAQVGEISVEVLVIDNASTDGSPEAIRQHFPSVRLILNARNAGFGAANNQAMAQARGEFFLLLNSDAFLKEGALGVLLSFLRREPRVAVVGPRLLNADGSVQCSCYHFPTPLLCWLENLGISKLLPRHCAQGGYRQIDKASEQDVDFVIGACILVRRELYQQIGGFDEQFFMYQEEADWQQRARTAGWRVVFTPSCEATHLGGASGKSEPVKINQSFFESLDRYELKHHGLTGFLLMRAAMLCGCLSRAAFWSIVALLPPWRVQAWRRAQRLFWLVHRQALTGLPGRS